MKVKAIILNTNLPSDRIGDVCYLELPYNGDGYMRYEDDRWPFKGVFRCDQYDFRILGVKTYYEL
jgi:hypothetical protein